ncbi:MAG: hypothetical protein HQK53_10960 [Oligoflexia bacterium]|nr:hypothetical protein [Oligoflexia bacterium]
MKKNQFLVQKKKLMPLFFAVLAYLFNFPCADVYSSVEWRPRSQQEMITRLQSFSVDKKQ